jgi:Tfp pilus tip-associated adhesin PilY1
MMKKNLRTVLLTGLCLFVGLSASVRAEDTDIYVDNSGTAGTPNVLFIFDNAASFDASATNTCTYVDDHQAPSLGNTSGGVEQCALYNTVYALTPNSVNIGLMVYESNNIRDVTNANCGNSNGGCLVQPLIPMSGTAKAAFLAWIKTWKTTGGTGDGYIKSSTERTGAVMQEAWAYYKGATGLSGRNYAGIQPTAGCQKNFVIFVGNAFGTSGTPGDGGSAAIYSSLASAGASADQLKSIAIPSGSYGASNFSCGNYSMGNHTDSSGLYGDEWSQFMKNTDIFSTLDDSQGIITYTIGFLGTTCKPDYPALMTSMAKVGGGKYFATSSYDEIKTAIDKILNEVQAVNSVFASATLPVSVNAQGTYLNQIYLGMFRPDPFALPRWVGNLKQFQFALVYNDPSKPDPNNASLILADANGDAAISSTSTGFISANAVSFWTYKDTSNAPDDATTGGFFVNDSRGAGKTFDKVDGEQVDKGGAAQQIRKKILTTNYTSTPAGPRKVYTFCPGQAPLSGGFATVSASCNAALNNTSNAFATSNASITDTVLGSSSGFTLAAGALTRTGNVATITKAGHGFSTLDRVTITGATQPEYNVTNVAVTAATANTFSFPVLESPASPAGGGTAKKGGTTVTIAAWDAAIPGVVRVLGSTTVTVNTTTAHGFSTGDSVTLANISDANGSVIPAYNGSPTVTVTGTNSFTYSVASIGPVSPATGTIKVTKVGASDRTSLINWVRGEDNYGDEAGPGNGITVRPSVHGDVLHSRPVVVNYGDSRGTVVFYGANDGMFHAVNGNQTTALANYDGTTVPAGGEFWSLVLPEHYSKLNRQRINAPELKFPSTTLATAQTKDYFVDGPTGVYQKLKYQLKADGTPDTTLPQVIDKAYLYLAMRRGGRFLYAIDVTTPNNPQVLWKIDQNTAGFSELGQTWSRPRITVLNNYGSGTPVLVFGAGYDPAQDSEPPTTNTMGRGIFVVNAETGALIWSANPTCTTSATCRNVPGMNYAIPSEVTFVDRDADGKTDKAYVGDTGGNIWRMDLFDASPANWTVSKLAALGCSSGTCAAGTTPRKFFFPAAVVSVGVTGGTTSYDAVMLASGDREHPLKDTATNSAYNVTNRVYFLKDTNTAVATPTVSVTVETPPSPNPAPSMLGLFDATSTNYAGTLNGYYITFSGAGEKSVNAPVTVYGSTYFGTNTPATPSATSCKSTLGVAKGYALNPFTGGYSSNVFDGGGLPPSPVSGLVSLTLQDGSSLLRKFCIGCAGAPPTTGGTPPPACNSALQNCLPDKGIPKSLKRSYWYTK